jgi:TLD
MVHDSYSSDQQKEPRRKRNCEILLDYFPLNAVELDQLLDIYDLWFFPCHNCTIDGNEEELLLPFESSWLPELIPMIRKAMDRVFVANIPSVSVKSEGGVTSLDDEGFWEPQLLSFLEACVSLCGRRGGYRFLLEALFFTAADDMVSISQISSLLFRLCVLCKWTASQERDVLPIFDGPSEAWSDFFKRTASGEKELSLTLLEWKQWAHCHVPMAPYALSTLLTYLLVQPSSLFVSNLRKQKMLPHSSDLYENDLTQGIYPMFLLPNIVRSSSRGSEEMAATDDPSWMNIAALGAVSHSSTHDSRSFPFLIPIQLTIMGLGGNWHPIYLSYIDGLSFPMFCDQLVRYCGPTLLLIESVNNEFFGYYTTIPWKLSSRWYSASKVDRANGTADGSDDDDVSFLFRLYPSWNIYRPQMDGIVPKRYHQFLNLPYTQKSIQHGQSNNQNTLSGLAVGGVADNVPRFHITPSFEQCKACAWDSVFEAGPLLSSDDESFFDVLNIEVWAVSMATADSWVNGDDVFHRGKEVGELRSSMNEYIRHRCAKVDRSQFVDDFANGSYENTLFRHRSLARGRADFVALDNERHGYFVDGKEPSTRNLPLSPSRDEDSVPE